MKVPILPVLAYCVFAVGAGRLAAQDIAKWEIPSGGNAYLTSGAAPDGIHGSGVQWQNPASVFSVFFRVDRAADLQLACRLKVPQGESRLRASVAGSVFEVKAAAGASQDVAVGKLHVDKPGYVRVDLQGLRKDGPVFCETCDLIVSSATQGLVVDAVKTNKGEMFYWGRRGPSVHLSYALPPGKPVEFAYNELTVPPGADPVGSYFMANGFGEGYFGIQVVSPTERWVLFSVWSPFVSNNPKDIPEAERVVLLAKGEGVRGGEFGGEGAGGKSVLVFPWRAGVTYRFLNSVKPDGKGNTVYSAWFGEAGKDGWKLIARFQRPKTNRHLTGFHSFLENFQDANGYLGRRAAYTNQWVCDTDGQWQEITEATFTGDATAGGRHRLDYAGGVTGNSFYLRNGGFFAETVALNQHLRRPGGTAKAPAIDLGKLP